MLCRFGYCKCCFKSTQIFHNSSYREKDGKAIRTDHHHDIVWEDDHSCYLLVRNTFQQDSGVYKVTATNVAGAASCQANLKVTPLIYRKRSKPMPDADEFAKHKAFKLADKVVSVRGSEMVDVHLTDRAKEALTTATASMAMFRPEDYDDKEYEKSKLERKKEDLALRMPYVIPEPVKHDKSATKEDLKLKSFVPLSDFKWYKKVGVENDSNFGSNFKITT